MLVQGGSAKLFPKIMLKAFQDKIRKSYQCPTDDQNVDQWVLKVKPVWINNGNLKATLIAVLRVERELVNRNACSANTKLRSKPCQPYNDVDESLGLRVLGGEIFGGGLDRWGASFLRSKIDGKNLQIEY